MKKTSYFIITVAIIIGASIILISNSKSKDNTNNITTKTINESNNPVENSEIKDGVQYITITAKGGYTPRVSSAKAGIPTKLIVITNGTFDCSAALVIRSIGYKSILPQTGNTEIDLGIPKAGSSIQGVCSMGMYNFLIKFS